jgi:hypothetical protein
MSHIQFYKHTKPLVSHYSWGDKGWVGKADTLRLIHTYHAVPLPSCAAKGVDCVFPI